MIDRNIFHGKYNNIIQFFNFMETVYIFISTYVQYNNSFNNHENIERYLKGSSLI